MLTSFPVGVDSHALQIAMISDYSPKRYNHNPLPALSHDRIHQ